MVFSDPGTSAVVAEVPGHGSHGSAWWARFVPGGRFGAS